jgi:DNA-binding transcriptional LysR family regulator
MNVGTLSTLVAIVDTGSFAHAARAVGCTPSAVSLQVRQLEAWLGRALFDRSARVARPTPFALEVAQVARGMLDRLEGLRQRPRPGVGGRVRLGAIATVQTDTLPHVLRALRDRYPALAIDIALDDSDALVAALKAGRIDMAALVRPASGGSSRLAWQDLARQPFVMLAPPDARAATLRELLERRGLVRYDVSLTGGRIAARYLRAHFPPPRIVMELRSIDAIVAMVSAGLGVSVVPRPRRELLEAHAVQTLGLGKRAPARRIALARRVMDADDRNLRAVGDAFAAVYGRQGGNAGGRTGDRRAANG